MIHSVRVTVQYDSLQFPRVMTLLCHLALKKLAENEDLVIASLYKQFSIQYIAAVRRYETKIAKCVRVTITTTL